MPAGTLLPGSCRMHAGDARMPSTHAQHTRCVGTLLQTTANAHTVCPALCEQGPTWSGSVPAF